MKKQTITPVRSIMQEIEALLNDQVEMEGKSSAAYLSMASWCDEGNEVSAEFCTSSAKKPSQRRAAEIFDLIGEEGIALWMIEQKVGKQESSAASFG